MPKNTFIKTIWVLFYIFVFVFLIKNAYNYLDPDLGWHLKVGEQILIEKQVPTTNYYNYTLAQENWVDHEWLSNLTMYWLYHNLGYFAVVLFFALIMILVLIILNLWTKKYYLDKNQGLFFILLFQLIGLFAIAPHLGVRVQEITLLNLLLLLIIICNFEKNKNYKILFFLPVLFYFWALSHGGFLIGLFITLSYLIIKLVELIIKKYPWFYFVDFDKELKLKDLKIFSLFAGLSVLATFSTPYKLELYSFLSDYKNTYYLAHIQEWLPVHYLPILYWQIIYSAFVAVAIVLVIVFSIKKIKNSKGKYYKINLWQLLISLLFLILAFKSKRHFPLLFIISFPLVVAFFTSFLALPKSMFNKKWTKPLLLIKSYLIIGLIIIIFTASTNINFTRDPFFSFCSDYPCEATQFLKEDPKLLKLKLYNFYSWGGYLIWTLPGKELFIDGRLPIVKFAKHTLLEEYHEFFKKNKAEAKLNQYNIKLILLKIDKPYKLNWFEKYILGLNEEKLNKEENYLLKFLKSSEEWKNVYHDKVSTIYVRK